MFDAVLSDDKSYVTLYYEDEGADETIRMDLLDFSLVYGDKILLSRTKSQPIVSEAIMAGIQPSKFEKRHYYMSFRRLIAASNDIDGKIRGLEDIYKHMKKPFGTPSSYAAGSWFFMKPYMIDLDYWSCQVGMGAIVNRLDPEPGPNWFTETLLQCLRSERFRICLFNCIEKCESNDELKSARKLISDAFALLSSSR